MNNRRVWDCIRAGGEVIVLLILFYRSLLWVLLIGTPLCFLQYRRLKRKWEQQHRWQLNLEFKEGLQGIAAALNAGYSIENAIEESRRDLLVVYGKESLLSWEFQVMLEQLKLNRPVEQVMDEFAARSGVQDIKSFAEVFRTARRSGGNLVEVTRASADRIGEKIEVSREIHTMIARKADGRTYYEYRTFGDDPLFLDMFAGLSGWLLRWNPGTDRDECVFADLSCGIPAQ